MKPVLNRIKRNLGLLLEQWNTLISLFLLYVWKSFAKYITYESQRSSIKIVSLRVQRILCIGVTWCWPFLCDAGVSVRDLLVDDGTTVATIVKGLEKDKGRGNLCHAMDLCSRCMGSLNYCQKAIDQVLEVRKGELLVATLEVLKMNHSNCENSEHHQINYIALKLLLTCGKLCEGRRCANCFETRQDRGPRHNGFSWPLHLSHWVHNLLCNKMCTPIYNFTIFLRHIIGLFESLSIEIILLIQINWNFYIPYFP